MKIDTNHILNKVCSTACMMLCYVAFFSCARVDLCENGNHTHLGSVSVVYDWTEIADSVRPDSILLLVNRVKDSRRVGYVTGSESSVGGRYRFGKMYDNAETGIYDESLQVLAGDYVTYAFNSDVDKKDKIYRFEYLNEYADGKHLGEVNMGHIAIAYVGRELSEMRAKGYLCSEDWYTVNPGLDYITTGIAPIYYATNERNDSNQVFTFGVQVGKESKVTLTPKKVTQDITLSFPVYTEKQIVIDSVIAQDVYQELTDKGYRVFFSRITLEDKLGTAYEPYIFAALHSAKVMVVLGTRPEHFDAVWVKNEWSRFLAMMKKDRHKILLPCYKDMDAYDLPEEFSHLQAQDMSKLGFMQDLIRGIKKIIVKNDYIY